METIHQFSLRLGPICLATAPIFLNSRIISLNPGLPNPDPVFNTHFTIRKKFISTSSPVAKAGWLLGLGGEKKKSISMPDIVKAGDPVLHQPARDVEPRDIGSERIQKIIDDMVRVMRKAPGVGLAAPQIGIPLKCIECPLTPHHLASESVSVAIANPSAEPPITHFDKSSSTKSTSLPPN
ncbi:hypothetical protein FF2_024843 [Malus domestica]